MNRETSVHRFGKIDNEKPQRVGSALGEEDLRNQHSGGDNSEFGTWMGKSPAVEGTTKILG